MDLKVYEGYKHNSASDNGTAKSTAQSLSDFNQTFNPSNAETSNAQPVNAQTVESASTGVKKSRNNKPRIALFIDVDNVGISRENLLEIIFYANGKYQIDQCRLYGFSDETLPGIREIAAEYNVTTIGKMKFKKPNFNCLDSRLLIDAYECAINNHQKIDMVFVWCYPCDLSELFEKIQALGVSTSTIENNAFDYKNKFVSQTFKLYSPYSFDVEQSTYGKIRNQPTEITPKENIEKLVTSNETNQNLNQVIEEKVDSMDQSTVISKVRDDSLSAEVKPMPSDNASSTSKNEEAVVESKDSQNAKSDLLDDDFVPPVLPRRTIVERSSSRLPRKEQEEQHQEQSDLDSEEQPQQEIGESDAPSSMVEEIARKLNLPVISDEEISEEIDRMESTKNAPDILANFLKQAGLGHLGENEKTIKYEDTIGDL